ncbi:phosphotransferase [Bacillus sp. CECT 9360]|uniref:phosphotransferase enzyme family protein n=1 Tax=Bacillus sp. CECT 9360 TaxID=2845821 RepID=UPI001E463A17|nr:phosphotransferase [Bacillus sp. CECT 9360]CAH0347176.1 Stress response kinase A [Bacillus sp. CECT 9360]
MERTVEMVFSDEILQRGAAIFQVKTESLKKIGDFENYVYSGHRDGIEVIVRYTHSSHRSYELLQAESDWVAYLKRNGSCVYEHFTSINGRYIERVQAEDGTEFYMSCYEKLPGSQVGWRDLERDQELASKWGAAMGKMNKITKTYQHPAGISRPHWDEEELFEIEKIKPDIDAKVMAYRDQVVSAISNLPKTTDNYGLIHSDLHSGNFLVHEGELNLFDFDDCAYHWFASDIAIPLYYIVFQRDLHMQEGRDEFAKRFFTRFLEGYRKENKLAEGTIEAIPLFLRLRDIVLLSVLYKKFDFSRMTEHEKNFFEAVKGRVERRETIIDLDSLLA